MHMQPPSNPSPLGLIFDCDGTLVLSGPPHYRAIEEILSGYGVRLDFAWYHRHLGMTFAGMLSALQAESGVLLDSATIQADSHRLFLERVDQLEAHPQVAAEARHYFGKLPMAVASNGHRPIVTASLRATGLLPLFQTVVTIEDVSCAKPAPDMFLEAARRLGVPAHRCHVYEDSDEGLAAARAAGMTASDVRLHPPALGRPA